VNTNSYYDAISLHKASRKLMEALGLPVNHLTSWGVRVTDTVTQLVVKYQDKFGRNQEHLTVLLGGNVIPQV